MILLVFFAFGLLGSWAFGHLRINRELLLNKIVSSTDQNEVETVTKWRFIEHQNKYKIKEIYSIDTETKY